MDNYAVSGVVRSKATKSAVVSIVLAVVWIVILAIILSMALSDGAKTPVPTMIFIGFIALVCAFFIYNAALGVLQAVKFGSVELMMDPNPGSIGGEAGGVTEIPVPFDKDNVFFVSLRCIHRVGGGGGRRSRVSSTVLWQHQKRATQEPCEKGTRLKFKFAVPGNMSESEAPSWNYKYWLVGVSSGDIKGLDFAQSFVVNVVRTAAPLKSSIEEAPGVELETFSIRSSVDVEIGADGAGGMRFFYPAWRKKIRVAVLAVIAVLFGVLIYAIGRAPGGATPVAAYVPFTVLFLLFSGLAVYAALNSLEVVVTSSVVRSAKKVMGFVVKQREMNVSDIAFFECMKGIHAKNAAPEDIRFNIVASSKNGRKMYVGDNILGEVEAANVRSMLEAITGVTPKPKKEDKQERL
ncbi:MAG: hypothetical protein OEV59_09390 [Deltaproteobacteria bacterium]|nr:hypothetical protein [Deltaproteobacteria bacterium]